MGTLQKFCQEESRLKPKEDRKAQIEKKLEEQQQLEREKMKRERQDLFQNRKRQQVEIKMLETKMTRMKELGTWEEAQKPLLNFIRTKAKPHIYYLPKVLDAKSEKRLEESRASLESECCITLYKFYLFTTNFPFAESIAKKRADTTDELAHIESRFRAGDSNAKNGATHHDDGPADHPDASKKHDRRNSMDDDDELEADDQSPFHQSDDGQDEQSSSFNDHTASIEPDLSLLKTERDDDAAPAIVIKRSATTDELHNTEVVDQTEDKDGGLTGVVVEQASSDKQSIDK